MSIIDFEEEGERPLIAPTPEWSVKFRRKRNLHLHIVCIVIDCVLGRVVESDLLDDPLDLSRGGKRLCRVENAQVAVCRVDTVHII